MTGGYFQLDVNNGFPLQSLMKLSFLDESFAVIDEIIGDALVLSSLTGSLNANGLLTKHSSIKFYLSDVLMTQFNQVRHIRIEAILDTPNAAGTMNQVVSMPVGAFMHVKLKAKLNTQIVY